MTTYKLTNDFHLDMALGFQTDIDDSPLYFFVGDYTTHDSGSVAPLDSTANTLYFDVYNKMIMGKIVGSNSISLGIPNIPYTTGTVYTAYDDTINLDGNNYYCVVNSGSFSHVYKCLDNNKGANSTVEPNFSYITGSNTVLYQTSDGYRWKYMYTVDSATVAKFATSDFFPYIANTTVISNAVDGSINVIKIIDGGKLYNNYMSGTFTTSQIKVNGDSLLYEISHDGVSTSNGYYTGCLLYLTSGTGIGQYKTVNSYFSNTTGNYLQLESGFSVIPQNGTTFDITPTCLITSDGTNTSNCIARALVNATASNTVYSIEILSPGGGYFIATANVISNSAVGVSSFANVHPIMSPQGGHGANPHLELNASNILVSVTLSNSESNTILTSNKFQQVGLLRSPLFTDVELTLTGATGLYNIGETISVITPTIVVANVTVNTTSSAVTGQANLAFFSSQFSTGDKIILSNGTTRQLATINNISSNTVLYLTSNSILVGNTITIAYPHVTETMVVSNVITTADIIVSNTMGQFGINSVIIGNSSQSYSTISGITRAGVAKDFKTFIQLYKYTVSSIAGTFSAGEIIKQGSKTALLHSYVGNNTIYVSNMSSLFTIGGGNIIGQSSGAIASPTAVFNPELKRGSGAIQYIDNVAAVTRQPNQSETFKFTVAF